MKKLNIIFFSLFAIAFTSCQEVIDFDLNEEQSRIVVDGAITTETKAHQVNITLTTSYYNAEEPKPATGATVSIDGNNKTFSLTEVSPGLYETNNNVAAVVGETYTLNINYDGEKYEATETVTEVIDMDTTLCIPSYEENDFTGEIDSIYYLILFGEERKGLGDYYLWHYYINGELMSDTVRNQAFADDSFVDGNAPVEGFPIYGISPDKLEIGDEVTLEMNSITKEYNQFLLSILFQTDFRGGPFDGPPANVSSNISNGAMGFFRASDVKRKTTTITY